MRDNNPIYGRPKARRCTELPSPLVDRCNDRQLRRRGRHAHRVRAAVASAPQQNARPTSRLETPTDHNLDPATVGCTGLDSRATVPVDES